MEKGHFRRRIERKRLLFLGLLFLMIFQVHGSTLAFTVKTQDITRNFECSNLEVTGESATQGSWYGCRLKGCIGNKSNNTLEDASFRFEAYGIKGKLWEQEIEIPSVAGKQAHCFNTSVPCYGSISDVKIIYLGMRGAEKCCSHHGGVDYCDGVTKRFRCKDGTYSPGYEAGPANSASAKYNLGIAYRDGQEVARNHVLAYMWFHLAANEGNSNAVMRREELERQMTSAQIAEAQELAKSWNPLKAACVCE